MADNTWTVIDTRMEELEKLNERMDNTANLLQWDDNPYKLVKPDGKTELRDSISVTPNLPKVFAHGVVADLLGGKWQTVVEGSISGTQSHLVESFIDDCYAQIDDVLANEHGIPSLFGWLCNHVCIRYAIGALYISQMVNKEWVIDCQPIDMRWTPYVLNKWVAPITFPSKSELEQELEKFEKRAKDDRVGTWTSGSLKKDNEVRDYWSRKEHELWVNSRLVYTERNHFEELPFVIVVPASGFMLRDKGYLKHEGEDILFLNAGLYKEYARSLSLEQTSGYAGLYPGYEYETKVPDGRPARPPPPIDGTLKVPEGERHEPVPRGDINRAGQTAREDLQRMLESGGPLSPREYKTPPSAVLLAGETELITRLQNARKDALGIFRSQMAKKMLGQFIKGAKGETELGKEGNRRKYSVSKMGDPTKYNITYHLTVKSKRQELANLAEFASVYDKLPLEWNLTNILMADDPAGIINDLELQKAKAINPALSLLDMAVKYAKTANESEDEVESDLMEEQSKILLHEYVIIMRQRTQPALAASGVPQSPEQPKGDSNLLSAMVGGGNQGGAV